MPAERFSFLRDSNTSGIGGKAEVGKLVLKTSLVTRCGSGCFGRRAEMRRKNRLPARSGDAVEMIWTDPRRRRTIPARGTIATGQTFRVAQAANRRT